MYLFCELTRPFCLVQISVWLNFDTPKSSRSPVSTQSERGVGLTQEILGVFILTTQQNNTSSRQWPRLMTVRLAAAVYAYCPVPPAFCHTAQEKFCQVKSALTASVGLCRLYFICISVILQLILLLLSGWDKSLSLAFMTMEHGDLTYFPSIAQIWIARELQKICVNVPDV